MILDQAESLMLVSLSAAVLPSLSRLLRLPSPVMEILFGVVLGKSFLHIQFSGEWIAFLAFLGFLLLMFHGGMAIDFSALLKQRMGQLSFHLLLFGTTLLLSLFSAIYLGKGVFIALVLATTSLGLVMPTLREMDIQKTPFGQTVLIAASLADFLTLLSITLFLAATRNRLAFFLSVTSYCRFWHLTLGREALGLVESKAGRAPPRCSGLPRTWGAFVSGSSLSLRCGVRAPTYRTRLRGFYGRLCALLRVQGKRSTGK
jgi:Kef-type K+ transport system membrane component KefB